MKTLAGLEACFVSNHMNLHTSEVTYRTRIKTPPKNMTEEGFAVSNAVPGTLVWVVDYTWKMPRLTCPTSELY